MYLAIEYLVRKGIVREWFTVPCSLFLTETFNKKVVTISEEFKPSTFYCVKHWHVRSCNRNQAVPSFTEFRVPKAEVFSHQAVVLKDHRLMPYFVSPIPFSENSYNHPMMDDIYQFFYNHYLDSYKHRENKVNWLWGEFMQTYLPQFCGKSNYIPLYKSDAEIASDQRNFVATQHPEMWQCWVKWCKYMLHLEDGSVPGELVFMGEYRKRQGGSCTEDSSSYPSLLLA